MADCPHENNPKECIAIRRTGPPARCMSNGGCKAGRANEEKIRGFVPESLSAPWKALGEEEKKKAKERYAAIYGTKAGAGETKPVPRETIQPKKEEKVDKEKIQENILRVLARKGPMTKSSLKLYTANEESAEDFGNALSELSATKKVFTRTGSRTGSLIVELPEQADIPGGVKAPTPPEKKTAAKKLGRGARKSPTPAPSNKLPKNRGGTRPAGEGFSEVIAALEAKRQNIDVAIAALKALG